jgi:hypothetical protein
VPFSEDPAQRYRYPTVLKKVSTHLHNRCLCYLQLGEFFFLIRWLPEPLSLAGIWNSPLLSVAIDTAAVDAAAAVEDGGNTSPVAAAGSIIRSLAQPVETNNSFYQLGLMNEDEALRLILGATPVR